MGFTLRTHLALLLAAAFLAPGVSAHDPQDAELDVPSRVVELDPGALLAEMQSQGALTLPTTQDPITFTTLIPQARPIKILNHDSLVLRERIHVSNVWSGFAEDGSHATLLIRPDRVQAIIHTPYGVVNIEPEQDRAGVLHTMYSITQPASNPPAPDAPDEFEGPEAAGEDDVNTGAQGSTGDADTNLPYLPSAVAATVGVTRTVTVYVDSQFANHYGGLTWPDQVDFIIAEANKRFLDVGLQYDATLMSLDSSMHSSDINQAFFDLQSKSFGGNNVRGYMSYRDFSGCTIGKGLQPGTTFLIQHNPDNCHGGSTPNTNFERAYLTKHELGHNNNADHGQRWAKDLGYHVHRSIMHKSAWYHYHDIWSNSNAMRMCTHLQTTCAGTQAVNTGLDDAHDAVNAVI